MHTEPTEMFWGDRVSRMRDPYGNLWWIHQRVAEPDEAETMRRMQLPEFEKAMAYVQGREFFDDPPSSGGQRPAGRRPSGLPSQRLPAHGQPVGHGRQRARRRRRPASASTIGVPASPASRTRGVQRDLAQQRHRARRSAGSASRPRPAPPPEPKISIRAPSGSSSQDMFSIDADQALVGLQRDRAGPLGHLGGGRSAAW